MPKWEQIAVKLSTGERKTLEQAAKSSGMTLALYLKHAALAAAQDTVKRKSGHELNWIHREAASRGHVWTEEELKREGLPLYWSEEWVRARLAEGCTLRQLAVLSGSLKTTVSTHLSRHFNLRLGRRTLSETEIQDVRERFHRGETRHAIAQHYEMTKSAISKYLRDQPSALETASMDSIQRVQPELGSPPVDAEQPWHQRLLLQQLAAIDHWPASVEQIAKQLFDGNRPVARAWANKQFKDGVLMRVSRGVYDLQ